MRKDVKMHNHTDKPCKHDLKVCTECGDVYCSKCKREWFKERGSTWYTYPYSGTVTQPYTITVGTNIVDGDSVQPSHTHLG